MRSIKLLVAKVDKYKMEKLRWLYNSRTKLSIKDLTDVVTDIQTAFPGYTIGDPMPHRGKSVEQLKIDGYFGVYEDDDKNILNEE